MLPSYVIGGKNSFESLVGKSCSDYNSLLIFGCPAYYHVKENNLGPRARKGVFIGFKKGVKRLHNLRSKRQEIILSRDITIDEASMVKPMNSQQVESEKTNMISQQVESDATLPSPDSSLSFEITPEVTQVKVHLEEGE